jgi:hypothetical protein
MLNLKVSTVVMVDVYADKSYKETGRLFYAFRREHGNAHGENVGKAPS